MYIHTFFFSLQATIVNFVHYLFIYFIFFICKDGFDVFNALNVMENANFLEELKFGKGDGCLQYYLYNWKCPEMEPKDVGLVLL